jgi:hypothetical protein
MQWNYFKIKVNFFFKTIVKVLSCWYEPLGRDSNNLWPPRSPDLTPLDFFLWGTLKERIYQTPV